MRRGDLGGALGGFLGTFVSRYSDYDGWWLLGFLVGAAEPFEIDLLGPRVADSLAPPWSFAVELARDRFADQLRKWGIPPGALTEARLTIMTLPGTVRIPDGGRHETARPVRLVARARTAAGLSRDAVRDVRVAPHDPSKESRRSPGHRNRRGAIG